MPAPTHVGLLYWYTTSAILGLLTIINLISKLATYISTRHERRQQEISKTALTSLPSLRTKEIVDLEDLSIHFRKEQVRRAGPCTRLLRASWIAWTKYVLLSDLPLPSVPWIRRTSRAIAATEIGWTMGYTAGVLTLSFYGTDWDLEACAKQTGWIAIAQIPLIIALAGKNNFISLLTGISYEKLNFLHRAAGRVCLLGSWLHTIGYMYLLGGISLVQLRTSLTTWGMISILSLSLMYLSSIRVIRQRIYEFFLVAHICLAALFLAGAIMHWSAVSPWIYPGIGLWAADRLLRLARLFLPALTSSPPKSTGTISLLTPSTIKLTLPTSARWKAGQHFFVLLPSLSRLPWETHPFTAAAIPGDGEASFIVRVRDGMTGRMKAAVKEGTEGVVSGRVEGPYGRTTCLRATDGVLIFAGGSGVSFAISHLLQIIADAKAGKSACRHVQIVWMVKSKLHLNWIQPLLLPALSDIPPSLHITLHIHVTSRIPVSLPAQAALPADPNMDGGDWQTYLEERAARPRVSRRLMSTTSWATFGTPGGAIDGTGPGTRRVSEATTVGRWHGGDVPASPRRSHETGRGEREDEEKSIFGAEEGSLNIVVPTFNWTDGYAGTTLPTRPPTSEFGAHRSPRRPSGPISPLHRARFQSIDSTHSSSSGPSSPTSPLRPRRESSGIPELTLLHARTRHINFVDTVPSPQRTRFSLDQSESGPPRSPDRRTSLANSEGSHKPTSPTTASLRKSSLAIVVTASHDSPDNEKLGFTLDPPSPVGTAELQVSIISPKPSTPNFSRPLPLATLQLPTGGQSMSRSSTADSFSSFSAQLDAPLLPFASSGARDGTSTPTVPLPPLPTFKQNDDDLNRLSPGLEALVRWHEGRAEPGVVISQMKSELKRGRMEVMVCGPASLLIAVKKATREEMRVGEVWAGGVRVGFHAEDFGW